MTKMPPLEKVFEAWTALVDDRFELYPTHATVTSSDGSKTYTVDWSDGVYRSNDNATYWQGYPGYPVLVVLLLQGRIPYEARVARWFSGVAWKELNDTFKGDYQAAFEEACNLKDIDEGRKIEAIRLAEEDLAALEQLNLTVGRYQH